MKTYNLTGMLPLVSLFTPLFANGQEAHKTERPNIIFVLADDMSYRDLSCYGQQRYRTPHKMANGGLCRWLNVVLTDILIWPVRLSLLRWNSRNWKG